MIAADWCKVPVYVSVCITFSGAFSAFPFLISWFTSNVSGQMKHEIAVDFGSSMAQISGIVIPQLYREVDQSVTYRPGQLIAIGVLCVSLMAAFILRFSLRKNNNRENHLTVS
ncbi:unnamed protein product [Rotaria magnacalcarata]|uniref:Uncharacterized protein n=1 Tax=Rotaria magnacalcarata TaxID=392030 RepID=A0A816VAT8_9BILA|nr:unnamed protein product [Rotaria magnacalcarata]